MLLHQQQLGHILGLCQNPGSHTPPQQMSPWCTVVEAEALKPHGMASTSTTCISNVFENIHAMSLCRWTHHHVVTPTEVGTHLFAKNHTSTANDSMEH